MSLPPTGTICLLSKPGPLLRGTVTLPATVTDHRPPYLRLEDAEGVPHYRFLHEVELPPPAPSTFGPLFEAAP